MGVSMGNERTRLSAPEAQLMEQALALAHSNGNLVAMCQVVAEQLSVPKVLLIAQFSGGLAKVPIDFTKLSFRKQRRASRSGSFLQACEPARLKTLEPVLNSARALAKKLSHLITALPAKNEQDSVEAMVIARLFRTENFFLDGDLKNLSIFDFQFAHAFLLPVLSITEKRTMRNHLCRCI
jgi:hypothetical protein